jgi:hypothetical protein
MATDPQASANNVRNLLITPIGFAELVLGLKLYPWQDRAVTWFEHAAGKRVKASLCTPNGAGKDSVVIATLALWWISVHRRGRVVITSRDARQIDEQTMPALRRYRAKFREWRFLERSVETPTGGRIVLFTTDEPGRAEGFHRETRADGSANREGPLLMIANEAKSIGDDIFTAFDRCTFDGLLYASSPGPKVGRFYESQLCPELGFLTERVGLRDCPHIPAERIADITRTYGETHPFTRSTLHGEFMDADGELRFDREGLDALAEMASHGHAVAERLVLHEQAPLHGLTRAWPAPGLDKDGWVWCAERPRPGCSYIGFCDPMTGEQSEGSRLRDTHAAGILRAPYVDGDGVEHDAELVAAIYTPNAEDPSGAACRWDNDILAQRFAMLLKWYGNPMCIVEANNAGTEVIRLLLLDGCHLWRREKPNHRLPGRKMLEVVGFQTNGATKGYWIGALQTAIRERMLVCKFAPAVHQCGTFVLNEKGSGEAQPGCHDDWVTGLGLALYQVHAATTYVMAEALRGGREGVAVDLPRALM